MRDPKPGMSSKRDVLFHPRWRTVHEVWPDGTTRCGNGHTIPVVAYVSMKADELPSKAHGCKTCARVIQNE
jgi:hypothetical protein